MNKNIVISADNISKQYYLGNGRRKNTNNRLIAIVNKLFNKNESGPKEKNDNILWALKEIEFAVERSEIVGVIGRNGAGKSTLLKILTKIVQPTSGKILIKGRVGSLLEVGTGFHPELSGRENVYLNGTILGMTRKEISRKFDEIVAFSEVEKFIDTPVKRYSSGMYTRLAFSVAAHLESEILLVDEVLAVGDLSFQKKCLGKMGEISKGGRTILFVSHNMGAISELCSRCIFLDKGLKKFDGNTAEAIQKYTEGTNDVKNGELILQNSQDVPIYVTRLRLCDADGNVTKKAELFSRMFLEIEYTVEQEIRNVVMAMSLAAAGCPLIYSYDVDANDSIIAEKRSPGKYKARLELPTSLLKEGSYSVEVKIGWNNINVSDQNCIIFFEIENNFINLQYKSYRSDRPGYLAKNILWEVDKVNE